MQGTDGTAAMLSELQLPYPGSEYAQHSGEGGRGRTALL